MPAQENDSRTHHARLRAPNKTRCRPNGPGEHSPGLRPKADALGQRAPPSGGLKGRESSRQSQVEDVRAYIRNQREHHRVKSFQEELRAFLKAYEIEFDERYAWD